MEHHLMSYSEKQMKNSVYKGRDPKLERMDNPLQWQDRMELNTDRDGEGDDKMNLLQISVKFIILDEIDYIDKEKQTYRSDNIH